MDDKDLERQLVNYLAEGKKERVSMFDQLKGLGSVSQSILHRLALHEQKDDLSFASIQDHLKGLASRLTALEKDDIVTGRHDITQLQRELDERKKAQQGLSNIFINAGVGGALALVGALLALLVNYMLRPGR